MDSSTYSTVFTKLSAVKQCFFSVIGWFLVLYHCSFCESHYNAQSVSFLIVLIKSKCNLVNL